MTTTKIEFAVQMTCEKCVSHVQHALEGKDGIHSVAVDLEKEEVVVETSLPSSEVKRLIESTGKPAVLKGYGSTQLGSAVAMLGGVVGCGSVQGVIRFIQADEDLCIIDGTIDGLTPGEHGLHVHECGDLSQGCSSVGKHFNPRNTRHGSPVDDRDSRHDGDLGNVVAGEDGHATFRLTEKILKVSDIIGRSVVVTADRDDYGQGPNEQSKIDGNAGERLACGVIAQSAGMFENSKRICACDGVLLWDERNRPLAGPGRRATESTASSL